MKLQLFYVKLWFYCLNLIDFCFKTKSEFCGKKIHCVLSEKHQFLLSRNKNEFGKRFGLSGLKVFGVKRLLSLVASVLRGCGATTRQTPREADQTGNNRIVCFSSPPVVFIFSRWRERASALRHARRSVALMSACVGAQLSSTSSTSCFSEEVVQKKVLDFILHHSGKRVAN